MHTLTHPRFRTLVVLLVVALALAACDAIIPTSDSFTTTENLNTYVCSAATAIRTFFLVIGMLFAIIGITGFGLKQFAPSLFAQAIGGMESQVGKILIGGLTLGFGPGVVAQFFVAMSGGGITGCL